ncbi:MAG TPA: type II toxin-antitoxin system Phd/YefM family antitoxin [Candidatus Saccharimonadales bacterium]|nr:type II toxin-antitoxin system Phd/YefM family antitoxin [Candidatus Saccharimonadales bacterium]
MYILLIMTEKTITITEARKEIARITDEVEQKKVTYAFTKHGQVVAKLVPPELVDQMRVDPDFYNQLEKFMGNYDEMLKKLAKR